MRPGKCEHGTVRAGTNLDLGDTARRDKADLHREEVVWTVCGACKLEAAARAVCVDYVDGPSKGVCTLIDTPLAVVGRDGGEGIVTGRVSDRTGTQATHGRGMEMTTLRRER